MTLPESPPIRAFLSYSTREKHIAAQLKSVLAEVDVSCFMAHEDIRVSETWRDRIIAELSAMDLFIPLLSQAFRQSEWTSQEVGFAVARPEVVIFPLSLDGTIPYGFISALQGRHLANPIESQSLWESLGFRFPRHFIRRMIRAIASAPSYRGAERRFEMIRPYLGMLTTEEATSLALASAANSEVWDAGLCRTVYLPEFLAKNRHQIAPEARESLEERLA